MGKRNQKIGFYGLAAIAMAGLISAQVYWIKSDFVVQEKAFADDLAIALTNTVDKVENCENEALASKIRNINITIPADGKTTSEKVKAEIEALRTEMLKQKQEEVDQYISTLMTGSKTPLEKRFNKWDLNKILGDQLLLSGINMEYQFVVVDNDKKPVMYKNQETKTMMNIFETAGNTVQLFPNAYSAKPIFLSVYFPYQTRFILSRMWMPIASSVISMLILIILLVRSQLKPNLSEELAAC
ncbi:MAG TPA: hypothetical protein VK177_17810 [Flavobacteriales bacterium]|nr:hypothetical protein [Flavobacteriales bacterium]